MVSHRRTTTHEQHQLLDLLDIRLARPGPRYMNGILIFVCTGHIELVERGVAMIVRLTTSTSTFGPRRWFSCPSCGRRCRILVRDSRTPSWGCYSCRQVTFASRLRGRTLAYRLLERHAHALERARAAHRRHPRSARAAARYFAAVDRYEHARRDYLAWAAAQVDALARKVS